MDREILARYIVDRLSAAANRDDIIRCVCQRGGLDWQQAKACVADVEETHITEIERRRAPFNLVSAVMVSAFGALVTTYAVLSICEPLLGRPLPNIFYLLNDFGVQYGLLPDTRVAVEKLHQIGLLPDFWRTLYTQGQSVGISRDVINVLYVLSSGYLFWPFLLMGIGSLVAGSVDFFRSLFQLARR
jgi:hypothetical protein